MGAYMNPKPTDSTTRRPFFITLLAVISLLRMVKDLIDLVAKPVELLLPNHDVQVWFGYRFEGMAAKILTLPHLLIYGYAAYGLFRMTQLGWWVTVLYLLYLPVSLLLYMLRYATGKTWELVFVAISVLLIALIEAYLYTHRHL